MRRLGLEVIFVLLVLPPGADSQQPPPAPTAETHTASGLHTVVFRLPKGDIRANFPDDLSAGDTISGTVFEDPASEGELSGYVLEVNQERIPVQTKAFRWAVPPASGGGTATVVLRDAGGHPVAQSSIPVGVPAAAGPKPVFDLPASGAAPGIVSARGPFDGDFRNTTVAVGGAAALLLAESPRKIVFQPPAGRPGPSRLEIKEGDLTAGGPFRGIAIQLAVTRRSLLRGQTAVLTATVQGLQDLNEPADLILLNRSPGVAALEGGAEQRLVIEPGKPSRDGTFIMQRRLTGITPGTFAFTAIAGLRPTSQFDLPRAVELTVLDWQRSTGVPITEEARNLIGSSVVGSRNRLDDFLRRQETYRGDPVSITDMLVRGYCFDLRDRRRPGVARGLGLPAAALGFQAPGARPALAIAAGDVKAFDFGRFLSQLLRRLSPNQPVGYLLVSSRPDEAPISIDNQNGPDRTNRKFVVSPGTHVVAVTMPPRTCRKSVEVQPYRTGTVACP